MRSRRNLARRGPFCPFSYNFLLLGVGVAKY